MSVNFYSGDSPEGWGEDFVNAMLPELTLNEVISLSYEIAFRARTDIHATAVRFLEEQAPGLSRFMSPQDWHIFYQAALRLLHEYYNEEVIVLEEALFG